MKSPSTVGRGKSARRLGRRAYAAEIDPTYFQYGIERFFEE